MRKCIYILIAALTSRCYAQDLHFSQYNENPSLLNPALTGANSQVRAALNYKDQWKSVNAPFRTMGATFELRSSSRIRKRAGKFGTSPSRSIGRYAGGVSFYRDRAGDGKMGITMGSLNFATFVPVGKRSTLSAGFQATMVQRRLEPSNLIFPSQFNGTRYDESLSSGENTETASYMHADYAAGLLWFYGQDEKTFITHKEIKARLGASLYHFMEPTREFIVNSTNLVQMKYVAHGDMLVSLPGGSGAIAPSFVVQLQGKSMELIGGFMYRYYSSTDTRYTGYLKRTTLGIGAYYRNADAVVIHFLMELQEQYAIGLSYDINISKLAAASGMRGGIELTLRYSAPNFFLYQHR